MNLKVGMALLSLLLCAPVLAAKRVPPKDPQKSDHPLMSDVHILMYQVLAEVTALQPLVASDKKFKDPKNEAEINSHLDELTKLSEKVIRTKELQTPTFRVSGQALDNHLRTAKSVFKSGQKEYARWMLQATPMACASCHTQLPEAPKPLWGLDAKDFKGSDFERAEFLFGTRNYNPALELYSTVIAQYPGNTLKTNIEASEMETALKRKLVIYVRSKNDIPGAIKSFQADLKNPTLPDHVKRYLKNWISQLEDANKDKAFDPIKSTDKQVLDYARKRVDPKMAHAFVAADNPKIVKQLLASTALYNYLDSHPRTEATPDILYWLALTDYSLNNEFFFSLGNMYLIECIRSYPASQAARQCYDEYAKEIEFLYTGSAGTEVPAEAKQALSSLKALMDSSKSKVIR